VIQDYGELTYMELDNCIPRLVRMWC